MEQEPWSYGMTMLADSSHDGLIQTIPGMVLAQTKNKAHDQGYDTSHDKEGDEADAFPSSSPRDVGIVPQILELLSFRAGDIPETVFGWFLPIFVSRRFAQKPSTEGTMVGMVSGRRCWRRIVPILFYDRQAVIQGTGTGASPASSCTMGRVTWERPINKVGRPNKVEGHGDRWRT